MIKHLFFFMGMTEVATPEIIEEPTIQEKEVPETYNMDNFNYVSEIEQYIDPEYEIKDVCYPGSGEDTSVADRFPNTVHIDNSEQAIKALKEQGLTGIQQDIENHGSYDLVVESRSQTKGEHIDKLVRPDGYIMVENARALANYFHNSSEYDLVVNMTTGEKDYTPVTMDNQFSSGDTDRYLFRKHPSKKRSGITGKIKSFLKRLFGRRD